MKAEELRIGNLVYWNIPEKLNVPHEVVGIFQNRLQTHPISLGNSMEEYLPIPLTPEWLERFGFKLVDMMFENVPLRYWRKDFIIVEESNVILIYNDKEVANTINVSYVHLLQNAVYTLTVLELELKQ